MSNKVNVAHIRNFDRKIQSVEEHLLETSYMAGIFAEKFDLKRYGELAGILHDIGKSTEEFQLYILSGPNSEKIDHSTAGAQLVYRYFTNKRQPVYQILRQILSLVIASHHSGLIDCISPDGTDTYTKRMIKSNELTRLGEAEINLDYYINEKINTLLSDETILSDLEKKMLEIKENIDGKDQVLFKIGLLTRIVFSCLIDADRISTADFEKPGEKSLRNFGKCPDWTHLSNLLEEELSKIQINYDIDWVRRDISLRCLQYAGNPRGIYQLSVPTGGGKTLSSLRFALNHAKKHNMDKIIYVIPYTSIIDQNAKTVRSILEPVSFSDTIVLEHHSNLTPEKETVRQSVLSQNWDAPIIFTTMVQFLECLFGSGTRSVRRMHQMANAVLIFDEIQTLPIKCVYLFNSAIRFLVKGCHSSVLLCTATQPLLDKLKPEYALPILPENKIVVDISSLYRELKRVTVHDSTKVGGWSENEISELTTSELRDTGSVLTITNTKSEAAALFEKLQGIKDTRVYHLSTSMCAAHRMDVLKDIKDNLDKRPIICISTQLIEAGVDIDFGTVIRYLAGLDSIAQAAGRCNRNGKHEIRNVYIVNPHEENLDRLTDIQIGVAKTRQVLQEFRQNPERFDGDIISPEAMNRYYQLYFHERTNMMNYPVDEKSGIGRSDNLYDLLSLNTLSEKNYERINTSSCRLFLRQSFKSASEEFQSIESSTRGVIVPYSEGKNIIAALCSDSCLHEQVMWLKKAQRYTVNVFSYQFELLDKQRAIHETQKGSGIYYLGKQYYNGNIGLCLYETNEPEVMMH